MTTYGLKSTLTTLTTLTTLATLTTLTTLTTLATLATLTTLTTLTTLATLATQVVDWLDHVWIEVWVEGGTTAGGCGAAPGLMVDNQLTEGGSGATQSGSVDEQLHQDFSDDSSCAAQATAYTGRDSPPRWVMVDVRRYTIEPPPPDLNLTLAVGGSELCLCPTRPPEAMPFVS